MDQSRLFHHACQSSLHWLRACVCVEVAKGYLVEVYDNALTGRQKGLYVLRKRRGGRAVAGWRGGVSTRRWSGLTGEKTGRGTGGGAVGVIVSRSLASASNCLDECRGMAASQWMNR